LDLESQQTKSFLLDRRLPVAERLQNAVARCLKYLLKRHLESESDILGEVENDSTAGAVLHLGGAYAFQTIIV
jgi:hypothetical protein